MERTAAAGCAMLIPYRTDAPVYHLPIATVGIIVVNLLIQGWSSATAYEHAVPLALEFGRFAPLQWLTNVFLHAGWGHVVGNMVFLWVFGLVVEGKVGWWRFLALYGVIALATRCLEQLAMLGGRGYALGASGVITGLIAIAMVWAPENRVDCLLLFVGFRSVEWPIKGFALLFLALQVFYAATRRFGMSSEMLHLTGALCGLPLGILFLRQGWVDCEGWDWFSRAQRRRQRGPAPAGSMPARAAAALGAPPPAVAPAPDAASQAAVEAEYRASLAQLVELGQLDAALAVWRKLGAGRREVPLRERERLVNLLVQARREDELVPLLEGILAEDPGHPSMGLVRAQLLVRERRPAAAIEVLEAIQDRLKPGRQTDLAASLRAKAAALQAQGVLELG